MVTPGGTDAETVQQVDYTAATEGHLYADAWGVDRVQLSHKIAGAGYDTRCRAARARAAPRERGLSRLVVSTRAANAAYAASASTRR